jgi:glycosyltransferase involved in cell wall biosynthesis
MKILIICRGLPPLLDGIGDYTALLAAELAKSHTITILTSEPNTDPIPGVVVYRCFDAWDAQSYWQILDQVSQIRPDWILLQYNPFGYGRWGLNLQLPRVMKAVKKQVPGTRIALMVHEPFVPFISWQFAIMTIWQRWQLWSLGNNADVVMFSIQKWAKVFSRWFPSKSVYHLPVSSNIPIIETSSAQIRSELGISTSTLILGFFGQPHISRMPESIRDAALAIRAKGRDVLVLHIGNDNEDIRAVFSQVAFKSTGRLAASDVSRHLRAIDIYISAFVDGVSTRRGSMMAGLQHGLATVGTSGHLTDDMLIVENGTAFVLVPVSSATSLVTAVVCISDDAELGRRLGAAGKQLFEREFTWERVAARLFAALDVVPDDSATLV